MARSKPNKHVNANEHVSKDKRKYTGIQLINHTNHTVTIKKLKSEYPHVIFLLESEDTATKQRKYTRNLGTLPDYSIIELNFKYEEDEEVLSSTTKHVMTNAGRDYIHKQIYTKVKQ